MNAQLTRNNETKQVNAIENGNRFQKDSHFFVQNEGCFFESLDVAIAKGDSKNGVGLWVSTLETIKGTFYQAGNANVWN